jgi:predicted Zn-dependent peptidase
MAVQFTEVDGVPTILAPTAGPMLAGLVFRVGRADETLARSGVTHLLEHLALFPLGLTDYHYNGTTGPVTTSFHTSGSEEDVTTFLTKLCASLANLPLDRLATEKSIIRTEWSSRGTSPAEPMPVWRYGAQGYGLLSYNEPGIGTITAEDLRQWASTWFTAENAVLWIAGDHVPTGLRLALPRGLRRPVPAPTSALPVVPAYFADGRTGVVMDAVVRTRSAAGVYAEVLERCLFRDLRQEDGVSYSAAADADPRGDGFATVLAAVDALPEKLDAALGGFVDTLARLRVGRIDQADIDANLAKMTEGLKHPDIEAAGLPMMAFELLCGLPVRSLEQRVADLRAVTIADVHEVAQEVMTSALLRVPAGRQADWAGFTAAPTWSDAAVDGTRYGSRDNGPEQIVVGPTGVSSVHGEHAATVRFDECVAMMTWPDGARRLFGADGFIISVEPTLVAITSSGLASIDAAVPPERLIPMPARDPDHIPKPKPRTAAPVQQGQGRSRADFVWVIVGAISAFVVATIACCAGGAFTVVNTDPTTKPDELVPIPVLVGSWVVVAVALAFGIWLSVVAIRHRKR